MYNATINEDIKKLRELRKLKDKTKYNELKVVVCKRHNVTARTVENWLNKRVPGLRKSRSDSGKDRVKVSTSEKKIAAELLLQGKKVSKMKEIIEKKTGGKISNAKMNKIRDKAETEILTGDTEEMESNFGDKAKEMFEKLFELDLIAPEAGLKIRVHNTSFIIRREYIEDICLILANAYNNIVEVKYKVDRNEVLKVKIMHLIEQQVRLAMSGLVDVKTIEAITRMFDKMTEQAEIDINIQVVEKVCKELKKDITLSEIISLLKKYQIDDNG